MTPRPRRPARLCRRVRVGQLHGDRELQQRQGMTTFTQLAPAPSDTPEPFINCVDAQPSREPWRYGHRALVTDEPRCNLHVFGFDSPEPVKHRIFRDWLWGNPGKRDRYTAAKRQAASEASKAGEHVMHYNARKQQVIREIYHRAFVAVGLLEE
jgi:GrpB-like predicted nucleotidyltransferase (UPF0157 family)